MFIREMSEHECRQMLATARLGRLGCARDNQPYVVPITFSYDGGHLYGFSTPGQKIDWMRANPLVCVQVDEQMSMEQWTSVLIYGHYQELPDVSEYAEERRHAAQSLHAHAAWWEYTAVPAAEWRRKSTPFSPIFFRINIDSLTGHRATPTKP